MKPVSSDNFGLLIAYLIPGFITLWALAPFVPELQSWLGTIPESAPTIGGFLYATIASVAAGLIVSAIRWALMDSLHHVTGIPLPRWDFRHLERKLAAFESIAEDHYRYYQHYQNGQIAVTIAYVSRLMATGGFLDERPEEHIAFMVISLVLFFGARDALRKYYDRTSALLGTLE